MIFVQKRKKMNKTEEYQRTISRLAYLLAYIIFIIILRMTYDELKENYKTLGEIVKEHKERKENKNQYRGKMVSPIKIYKA